MVTRMLIDGRHPEETRVAVVQGSRIEQFDFESAARRQIKGNIYLAKITRVEPSLQAAFVDYGGNRHGFLAFSEIHPDYYQIPKEDRDALLREERQLAEEVAGEGDVDALPADEEDDGRTAFRSGADEGEGGSEAPAAPPEEHGDNEEAGAEALRRRRMALRRRYKIQEVIRRRQVMLVQVVKEERGNKGAALTTYISIAGRYSVLMPNTAQGGGISRKIANMADRKRLKAIMAEIALPPTMGAIIRTAGLERTRTEIRRDFDYLTRLWDDIRERTLKSEAPALIYEDSDLIKRAIRDIYSRDIDEVLVDGEDGWRQARDYMKMLMPSHAKKVQLYSDPVPLFHRAGVEAQLSALMNPVVQLRSGGYIVINPTEALVAIDVNSGRSTREHNIEETALKTNIEAAEEVARQLRLRDLAGLIVVDFIDMDIGANNRKVERALKEALRHDRARIQVGRISAFGLLEMSRQRLRTGVLEASTRICPMCDGAGLVRTPSSAALAALRLLEDEAIKGRATRYALRADAEVAVYMLNRKRAELAELEARYGIAIEILPDDALIGGRTAIEVSGPPPAQAPRMVALAPPAASADIHDVDGELDEEAEEAPEADATGEGYGEETSARDGGSRRRRGRGRRGRDDQRGMQEAEPVSADGEAEEAGANGAADDAGGEGSEGRRRRRRRRRRRDGGDAVVPAGGEYLVAEVRAPALLTGPAEAGPAEAEPLIEPTVPELAEAALENGAAAEAVAEEVVHEQPAHQPSEAELPVDADAIPAAPQAEPEAPAPRRRRTARAAATGAADAAPARAPRRRRAAAADAAPVETAAAMEAAEPLVTTGEAPGEAPAPAAPRRRSAVRSARKAVSAPVAADEAADVAEPAPAEPAAAPPAAAPAAGDDAQADAPPRRGWWQRTFGE